MCSLTAVFKVVFNEKHMSMSMYFFLLVFKIGIGNPSHHCIQLFYRMRKLLNKIVQEQKE